MEYKYSNYTWYREKVDYANGIERNWSIGHSTERWNTGNSTRRKRVQVSIHRGVEVLV